MKNVFIMLCLLFGLSACHSSNAPSSDITSAMSSGPGKSVETLMTLLNKGEVNSAEKFFDKNIASHETAIKMAKLLANNGIKTMRAEEKNIHGDMAVVDLSMELAKGNKGTMHFDMLRENGEWHVSGVH
jgi:predicted RNA binding protein with dsRBD fold (UPF0201 family)